MRVFKRCSSGNVLWPEVVDSLFSKSMLIQMPYQMHAFLRHLRLRRHRADEIGELSAPRSLIRIKDAGEARRQLNMSVTLSCFDIGRTVVNGHQINAYAQYSIYECF